MKLTASKSDKPKQIRVPKQMHVQDFQFFPPRLEELYNKEYFAHLVSSFFLGEGV